MKKQEKTQKTKERILAAALEEFGAKVMMRPRSIVSVKQAKFPKV